MTPRLSIIAAAIRRVISAVGGVVSAADYYWDKVVLAMKMDTGIDPEWSNTVLAMPMDKDPHWDNVALALTMEGLDNGSIFTDLKGSGVTGVNGALTKTGVKKVGSSSAYFNGSSSYLNIPTATIFDLSTLNFTIESWIYFNTGGTFGGAILSRRYDGANGWCIVCATSNIAWRAKINGIWQDGFCPTTGITFETNKWYHVALERVGSVFTIYVDGVLRGTSTLSGPIDDTTQPLRVGTATVATNETPFNGYIDNLRVTIGVARYGRSFTILDSSFLTDGILDLKSHSISTIGTPSLSTVQSKFGGTSLLLNGTTDYLSIPTSTDFGFVIGDFTVECWVKTTTSGTVLDLRSVSGDLGLFAINGGFISLWNGSTHMQGSITVTTGAWVHLAWVRSSGVVSMFVDGVLDGVSATSATFGVTRPVRIGSDIAGTNFFNGYIDNLRISKVARYAVEFTPSAVPFLDGTAAPFIEETGKAVTVAGNSSINTTTKKYGTGSGYFDGGGDYLTIQSSMDFDIITVDSTVEFWVKTNNIADITSTCICVGSAASYWQVTVRNNNVGINAYNGSTNTNYDSTIALDTNWHHVAWVKNGAVQSVFFDGVLLTSTGTPAAFTPSINDLYVGANYNGGASSFNGYIDDLIVTKGIARYISNFTPPTASFATNKKTYLDPHWDKVVLGMHMNGTDNGTTFTDVKGKTVTPTSAVTKTATKKFGTASAYFDGTGDYLTVANSNDFAFGSDDFTIECWVYALSIPTASNKFAFLITHDSIGISRGWELFLNDVTGPLGFLMFSDNTTYKTVMDTNPFPLNEWNHIAVSKNGPNLRLFRNGAMVAIDTTSNITIQNPNVSVLIGSNRSANVVETSGNWNFNGYIDDLRVTKGVARYVANFQPVQLPFPEKAYDPVPYVSDPHWNNVVLAMHMDGADNGTSFVDARGNIPTVGGSAKTSVTQKKFGTASAYFDGTADYLNFSSADLVLGTGDFTIEFFVYPTVNIDRYIFSIGYPGHPFFYIKTDASGNLSTSGNVVLSSGFVLPLNTWSHIALARSGGTISLYLNGTRVGYDANSTDFTSTVLCVGGAFNLVNDIYFHVGYIDDLRITKGVGRYISNFTPPGRFPEVLPTFAPTQSRLVSAAAYSNNYGAGVNLRDNPAATGESTWPDFFSEFNSTAIFSYANGAVGAGSDTGTLGTYTIPFDPLDTYLLEANNASWSSDVCSFTLEFLNASNAVVACIKTTGTGSYRHDLYYGSSIAGATTMAGTSGYNNTGGTLTFTATQMVFTNVRGDNYNISFTFNCDGLTITQVRVSNVRANSTYTGNSSAFVRLYRQING